MEDYFDNYNETMFYNLTNIENIYDDVELLTYFLNYQNSPRKSVATFEDILKRKNYYYIYNYIIAIKSTKPKLPLILGYVKKVYYIDLEIFRLLLRRYCIF